MDSSTSTAHPHTWDFPGGSHGPAEQVLSNISHCLWVHEASWIQHRASEHPQQALQRFGAFSTPVWVTAQQIQTSAKPRSRESRKRTAMENVEKLIYFSPLSKTKLFYSLPSPSIPQALPGPSLHPQAHLENVEMSEPGGDYQSTVPGKSSSGITGHLCSWPGEWLPAISLGSTQQCWHHITGSS